MINIKETCLFDETVQFIRNYMHCCAASYVVEDLSRVFHAIDSATLQAAHRCTHAPYGTPAVLAADNGTISPVIQATNGSRVPSSRSRTDMRPGGKDTMSNAEHKVERKR